ncbi:MAG: serine/threonine protein kinase [Deltaproteobacteria bacterium]|jgi:serine/threonine protein kinase|nr:serine/threonine protein kinase [Deltaproteobacteria bacterium]
MKPKHGNIVNFCLPKGFTLKAYQIISVLGQGGFGVTYKALDTITNKMVVIKEHFPQDTADRDKEGYGVTPKASVSPNQFKEGLLDFLREAEILAKFSHPNIVPIIDYFEILGTAYYAMPFFEGQTLADILAIRPKGLMPPIEVLDFLPQILKGLQAVHAKGFLHRDLKPENIFFRTTGQKTLIDFGAARNALAVKTQSLNMILTPGFSPIEQYSTNVAFQGPWTDIYALGAVIFYCLTGQVPPPSPDRQMAVMEHQPDPFAKIWPLLNKLALKPDFLKAIEGSLKLNRRERIQGVAKFLAIISPAKTQKEPLKAVSPPPLAPPLTPLEPLELLEPLEPLAKQNVLKTLAPKPKPVMAPQPEYDPQSDKSLPNDNLNKILNFLQASADEQTEFVKDNNVVKEKHNIKDAIKTEKPKSGCLILFVSLYMICRLLYSVSAAIDLYEIDEATVLEMLKNNIEINYLKNYFLYILAIYFLILILFLRANKLSILFNDIAFLSNIIFFTYFIFSTNEFFLLPMINNLYESLLTLVIEFCIIFYLHVSKKVAYRLQQK